MLPEHPDGLKYAAALHPEMQCELHPVDEPPDDPLLTGSIGSHAFNKVFAETARSRGSTLDAVLLKKDLLEISLFMLSNNLLE